MGHNDLAVAQRIFVCRLHFLDIILAVRIYVRDIVEWIVGTHYSEAGLVSACHTRIVLDRIPALLEDIDRSMDTMRDNRRTDVWPVIIDRTSLRANILGLAVFQKRFRVVKVCSHQHYWVNWTLLPRWEHPERIYTWVNQLAIVALHEDLFAALELWGRKLLGEVAVRLLKALH